MVIMCSHHVMGIFMVIPMNIYYSQNYYYFAIVFSLQFAACIGLATQEYGFTLNVMEAGDLCKMKICVTVTFLIMITTRAIGYVYLVYKLLAQFWVDSLTLFVVGVFAALSMSLLNLLFVLDSTAKFAKFIKYKPEEYPNPELNKANARRVSLGAVSGPMWNGSDDNDPTQNLIRRISLQGPGGPKRKSGKSNEPLLAAAA